MFVLVVTRGPDQGKKLPLEPGRTYTIGCNQDASLVLTDPLVLKGHCSLEVSDAGIVLKNHTATAGTFVGDQKVSQAALKANSTFRVGATVLGIAAAPAPAPKATPPAPPDPLVGRIIGGYKLNELVGVGGMGKVYRATQLSLHREVAFKILRDHHTKDKGFRDLFINEARAAAQLIHPNVVQVYDAGTEGDLVYFSMEFLGKGSIEEILEREKRIPWEQAILQVLEAAHGLAYAESKGIVHRDIKPDNLMLNEDGRVKIADLGLAKRGEGNDDAGVIGTPHFIPPEQALGKEVDHRADIYSLGATFFRMITGTTLFTGKTAKEIVLKHIKEPPPAASSVDETVPDDLDLVLAKMLAKDPNQRYQSATDVIAALEEVCAHHGIKGAIIKKGVGKRVLIPLVLLLLVAAGAVYYLVARGPETVIDPAAVKAAQQAEIDRKAAEEKAKAETKARRQSDAENKLLMRQKARSDLNAEAPISGVYDDPAEAPRLEDKWDFVAKELEEFGKSDIAKEFESEKELSSKALREAQEIRDELARWKESAEDKRQKGAEKLKEARDIDARARGQLADFRAKRRYQAAANLCDVAGSGEPAKEDPFGPIMTWKWVSPVRPSLTLDAMQFKAIKDAIEESRKYFRAEHPAIIKEAQTVGNAVIEEARKIPPEADPVAIDAAIAKLVVVRGFIDEATGPKVPEIETLVGEARKEQGRLEAVKAERTAKHTADDRVRVRDLQRKLCSLDPDMTSLVMNCGYSDAINTWQKVLADDQIRTDVYKRFVRERIAMLQWCQFLFARFEVDVAMTDGGAGKPLKLLALEQVPFKDGDMKDVTLQRNKEPNERYKFTTDKQHSRQYVFEYGQFPMDWVYNSVFLHLNEPRWQQMTPEIQFALGAFCFETMQYADAAHCFDEVLKSGNGALATAARSLKGRAEREAKARAAYEAILKEFAAATTAAEVEALKKKVDSYRGEYEGTIFYIDVMDPANKDDLMKTEFYSADYPEVPPAPPPPERES